MRVPTVPRRIVVGLASVLLAGAVPATVGCAADEGPGETDDEITVPRPVADDDFAPVAPVDDSPFCSTLLRLDDDEDPPTIDELAAAYVDLLDDVPAEIRPVFDVVLAGLLDPDGTDGDGPGTFAVAAEELAEFVESRCRGTDMNPLSPPTVPE